MLLQSLRSSQSKFSHKGIMKVDDILNVPIGKTYNIEGQTITSKLVREFAKYCGFEFVPHVRGTRSVMSIGLGLQQGACLHGAATLCLINAALEKVFVFEEEYDVISFGYGQIRFEAPNIEGGRMVFRFTVKEIESRRLPIPELKKSIDFIKVMFYCEAFNSQIGSRVVKLDWSLGYLKQADVNAI
jgi:hypothetical protein